MEQTLGQYLYVCGEFEHFVRETDPRGRQKVDIASKVAATCRKERKREQNGISCFDHTKRDHSATKVNFYVYVPCIVQIRNLELQTNFEIAHSSVMHAICPSTILNNGYHIFHICEY